MDVGTARDRKAQLRAYVTTLLAEQPIARVERGTLAVGLCVLGRATYGLAVRYTHPFDICLATAERGRELAGAECDVREIGMVRAFQWEADELRSRVRPLRPGLSVAHVAVTAGTIGAFVTRDADDAVRMLSNNHVLADSDRGGPGDVIVQPGPADGGFAESDRVGVLEAAIALDPDRPNLVDAAIAVVDDEIEVDTSHPAGELTGAAEALDDIAVEKVGRTTGITRGVVSAIEVDGLDVGYPTGLVEFDDQIEVTGTTASFSAGGDSGSLVYRPDTHEAVGLLFAGSERGGPGGQGLTYCNPMGTVLTALNVRLAGREESQV